MRKLLTVIKKSSWKVRLLFIVMVLAIAGGLYYQSQNNAQNGYVFETVGLQNITEVVSESGNVSTAGKTNVFSPSDGIIEEIYINNGDIVTIDQELFKVKSTATEDDRIAAYAALAAAQSALKTAEQTKILLQSALEQAREGVIDTKQAVDTMNENRSEGQEYTQLEIDSIDSDLTSARTDFNYAEKRYVEADVAIGSARASVAKANLAYESTKDRVIKSPTIGTVSNLSISLGSSITASSGDSTLSILGLSSATVPALTIANFSSNEIVLGVNETDISKIQIGQTAIVDPDAIDSEVYSAVVKRIDDIGIDDAGIITYSVYLDVIDSDEMLKSGMTVDVDIITSEIPSVLAVSSSAVKPYKGGRAVRVLNPTTKELDFIPVEIGVRGDDYTEIIEGVTLGQQIVVSLTNEKIERSGGLGF